eukprot:IDg13509t1
MSSILAMRGWESNLFASILVPLQQFGSTTALFFGAVSIFYGPLPVVHFPHFYLFIIFVPAALFLLDSFILQSELRFRYGYMIIPIVAHVLGHFITTIVRVVRGGFASGWDELISVLYVIGGMALASSVATLITRIDLTRCSMRNFL